MKEHSCVPIKSYLLKNKSYLKYQISPLTQGTSNRQMQRRQGERRSKGAADAGKWGVIVQCRHGFSLQDKKSSANWLHSCVNLPSIAEGSFKNGEDGKFMCISPQLLKFYAKDKRESQLHRVAECTKL